MFLVPGWVAIIPGMGVAAAGENTPPYPLEHRKLEKDMTYKINIRTISKSKYDFEVNTNENIGELVERLSQSDCPTFRGEEGLVMIPKTSIDSMVVSKISKK